jgi:hypothetical protein
MALTNPFPFDWLHSRSSDRWRKWSTMLVSALRCLAVKVPEHGGLEIDYQPDGTLIRLPRPVPARVLARTGVGGIPMRDPLTGQVGEASVTLYHMESDSGARNVILGVETATATNDLAADVPGDVDVILWEEGGDLMVLGWVCS